MPMYVVPWMCIAACIETLRAPTLEIDPWTTAKIAYGRNVTSYLFSQVELKVKFFLYDDDDIYFYK